MNNNLLKTIIYEVMQNPKSTENMGSEVKQPFIGS